MTNTNCLSGLRCPECGSSEPLTIEATTMLTVFDRGVDGAENFEWSGSSFCECLKCGDNGTVDDFTITRAEVTPIDAVA